ncbi:hypothetical protein GCM10028807_35150 [Spirosoma daeguense]
MKVLIIGDEHTYGYGLPSGKLSYIGHFIRQIKRSGQAVSVEAYANPTMSQLLFTLGKLPLEQYDLIVLQMDNTANQPISPVKKFGDSVLSLPYLPDDLPENNWKTFTRRLKAIAGTLLTSILPIYPRTFLSALLKQIRPCRHKVLLLTPFPNRHPVERWLSRRSRAIILEEADEKLVSVFDTDSVIRPCEEYFLPNDEKHLSAVSHELLGRSLFDFYVSAPTIVTIQTIQRGDKWFDV